MDFDLVKELGAEEQPSAERLTLYIPDQDRDGTVIVNHPEWVRSCQELLTDIGGGATCFPPVTGTWLKLDGGKLWERTTMIYSFIDPEKFKANMNRLRDLLHRFGRETNQGKWSSN